jgi:CRP-like cAMP-binding protein
MFASTPQDLSALIQAMTTSVATDTAQNVLSAAQWELLAPYLQPINLAASEVLFAEGALDRNLYLVEYGSLSVHYQDSKERIRLAWWDRGRLWGRGLLRPSTTQGHGSGRSAQPSMVSDCAALFRNCQSPACSGPGAADHGRPGAGRRAGTVVAGWPAPE